jgi:hypothetical protein
MYQNPVLKNFGFEIRNRYQKINSMVIYPSEVLAPTGIRGMEDYFTEKTIAVHHSELSWINEVERKQLEEYKSKIEKRLECI